MAINNSEFLEYTENEMTQRGTPLVYMYTPRLLARKFPDCLAHLVPT